MTEPLAVKLARSVPPAAPPGCGSHLAATAHNYTSPPASPDSQPGEDTLPLLLQDNHNSLRKFGWPWEAKNVRKQDVAECGSDVV